MPEKKSPKSAAAAKPKSKPKPSGIAKKACNIKMKHKVDGHVKPAGKNCKKLINQGESSCGACHAIKDDGSTARKMSAMRGATTAPDIT